MAKCLYNTTMNDSIPLFLVVLKDGVLIEGVPFLAFLKEEEANKHVMKLNGRGTASQYKVVPIRAMRIVEGENNEH